LLSSLPVGDRHVVVRVDIGVALGGDADADDPVAVAEGMLSTRTVREAGVRA